MCTTWIDGYNGVAHHLAPNVDFVIAAAAALPDLRAHARAREWSRLPVIELWKQYVQFDWVARMGGGRQDSTISIFTQENDGVLRHFYTAHPWMSGDIRRRGIDLLSPIWNLMDLTPRGRGDLHEAGLSANVTCLNVWGNRRRKGRCPARLYKDRAWSAISSTMNEGKVSLRMANPGPQSGINAWLEEELLQQYHHDRTSVDSDWKDIFEHEALQTALRSRRATAARAMETERATRIRRRRWLPPALPPSNRCCPAPKNSCRCAGHPPASPRTWRSARPFRWPPRSASFLSKSSTKTGA